MCGENDGKNREITVTQDGGLIKNGRTSGRILNMGLMDKIKE